MQKFLEEIQNQKILSGLITGNLEKIAYYKLTHYNVSKYFALGGFGSDYWDRAKLITDTIKKAKRLFPFSYNGHNVLYIADTPNDVIAARKAGIPIVIVENIKRDFDFTQNIPNLLVPDLTYQTEIFQFFESL